MGQYQTALKYTNSSIEKCPIYLKAQNRLLSIYQKLNMSKEAKEKRQEIKNMSTPLPFYGCCALLADWFDLQTFMYYQIKRFNIIVGWLLANKFSVISSSTVSLVDFYGGQYITVNFTAIKDDTFDSVTINSVMIKPMDQDNGSMLDLPPHGVPSELSKKIVPKVMELFMEECVDGKLTIHNLFLGQGLIKMVDVVRKAVRRVNPQCNVGPVSQTQHGFVLPSHY